MTRPVGITITGSVQKQAWVDRTTPPIEQVRESTWVVPMVFPDSPIRYTFCYIVCGADRQAVVIDPGFDTPEGRHQLHRGLASAGVSLSGVVGVAVTHLHADHLGMASYVVEQTGAWVGMHPVEDVALEGWRDSGNVVAMDRLWLQEAGVPPAVLEALVTNGEVVSFAQSLARMTLPLTDGARLPLPGRRLDVVATPGHTPGHICFVDRDDEVLFSGDHILPRITPNVGLTSTGRNDHALTHYYASLARVREYRGHEVLAAHEYRFEGLAERADELEQHQRERSAEVLWTLERTPRMSAWGIAQELTWARPWSHLQGINLRAALGEVVAHLDHLHNDLTVNRSETPDGHGAAWSLMPAEPGRANREATH